MRSDSVPMSPLPGNPSAQPVPQPRKINPVTQRLLTGIGLIAGIMALVWAGPYGFLLFVLLLNGLGLWEFYRLFTSLTLSPHRITGLLLSTAMLIAAFLITWGSTNVPLLIPILLPIPLAFSVFVTQLYIKSENPFLHIAFTFLGILCVTAPLVAFTSIAFFPFEQGRYNPDNLTGYFCLLWASDTGAFLIGRLIGKHKLFERISPNKTWEGILGGAFCALGVAFVVSRFSTGISLTHWLIIALIVVVAGTYGDLIKSMMKRSLGVKDAGSILPGHGGILDRFDSLLGSAPFVLGYILLSQVP